MPNDAYDALSARIAQVFEKQVFFICGMEKSGTTWLELLLDSHPEVVCKGEAHFFDFLRQYLGEALNQFNRRLTVDGGHTTRIAYEPEDLRHLLITAAGLMLCRWCQGEGIKCVGEKTPANLRVLPLLVQHFPDAKIVHMIRDGRDATVSGWFFNLKRNEKEALATFKDFSGYVTHFAKVWCTLVAQGREFGGRLGERYHELRYESLLERPDDELQRLFAFLGADASAQAVGRCLDAASFQKLSEGRNPGQEERGSFYRKGVSGDWVNHFSDRDAEAFHRVAGPLLQELGYTT